MKEARAQHCDPLLGRSVRNGARDICSRCEAAIPEHHVPLMLWDRSGLRMWVICEACEPTILKHLVPRQ
jgi:hypothetical protein